VQDEPVDLPPKRVTEILRTLWNIRPAEVNYAPAGHGSHHWIASNEAGPAWFVTGDRLSETRWAAELIGL
jgi:spectinomycin phosphotransferase